jgi:hypothetical protein
MHGSMQVPGLAQGPTTEQEGISDALTSRDNKRPELSNGYNSMAHRCTSSHTSSLSSCCFAFRIWSITIHNDPINFIVSSSCVKSQPNKQVHVCNVRSRGFLVPGQLADISKLTALEAAEASVMEYCKPYGKQKGYAGNDDVDDAQEVVLAAYPGCCAQHKLLQYTQRRVNQKVRTQQARCVRSCRQCTERGRDWETASIMSRHGKHWQHEAGPWAQRTGHKAFMSKIYIQVHEQDPYTSSI